MNGASREFEFTKNWFVSANAPETWKRLIPKLPARKSFLEVGSFEGQSTAWIVENMIEDGGRIICIDTFAGDETIVAKLDGRMEARFDHNVAVLAGRHPARAVEKRKGTSYVELARLAAGGSEEAFDFVYIDGSHLAPMVLTDACMAWPLLKPGGVMVFDDYLWGQPRDILHRPKLAIDSFLNIFSEQLIPLFIAQQLAVQKSANPSN